MTAASPLTNIDMSTKSPPSDDDDDGSGKNVPMAEAATQSFDEEEHDMCYLCFGEGPDETGQPLRRDCSCRGGSGFAHLSCIIEYAKQKSQQRDGNGRVKQFTEPWRFCPNCKQMYQDELALDLVNEFVIFVEGEYPGDRQKHLWALDRKLHVHVTNLPEQMEEAEQITNTILSIIGRMKTDGSSLTKYIQRIEADAYSSRGLFAKRDGTKEGAKASVAYFEKCRNLCEEIGETRGVLTAEENLARAKSQYEGSSEGLNNEEELELDRKLYEHDVKNYRQDELCTIRSGIDFALSLYNTDRSIESERLLTKLAAISKRVHGLDHWITKEIESDLHTNKERFVKIKSRNGKQLFEALRYEQDGKKCVVQGPIAEPRNAQEEETFAVDTADLRYALGTPLICHGLKIAGRPKKATHLNGKIGDLRGWDDETNCYEVHFEDKKVGTRLVNRKFLRILFELPNE